MPRFVNDIILHSTEADQLHYSENVQDFSRMSYHYIVRKDGKIERGRAISQPARHCRGHNAHSVSVAYEGGSDGSGKPCDTRTKEQRYALLKLLANLTRMYRCHIHSHADFFSGACPGFDATSEYAGLYKQICL